jgi:hypothetical protein
MVSPYPTEPQPYHIEPREFLRKTRLRRPSLLRFGPLPFYHSYRSDIGNVWWSSLWCRGKRCRPRFPLLAHFAPQLLQQKPGSLVLSLAAVSIWLAIGRRQNQSDFLDHVTKTESCFTFRSRSSAGHAVQPFSSDLESQLSPALFPSAHWETTATSLS